MADVNPPPELLTLLLCGDREIAEDEGYDLDEVLAEADQILVGVTLKAPPPEP